MTMVFSLSKIFHSIEWLLDTKKKKRKKYVYVHLSLCIIGAEKVSLPLLNFVHFLSIAIGCEQTERREKKKKRKERSKKWKSAKRSKARMVGGYRGWLLADRIHCVYRRGENARDGSKDWFEESFLWFRRWMNGSSSSRSWSSSNRFIIRRKRKKRKEKEREREKVTTILTKGKNRNGNFNIYVQSDGKLGKISLRFTTISIDSIRVEFHALTRVTAYKLRFDRWPSGW